MSQAKPAGKAARRASFAPQPERGTWPSAVLAVLVHMLLLLCLSWVVKWRDQPVILTAQAELWDKLALQNQPEPLPPPEPPAPTPAPTRTPEPAPPPPARARAA